MARFRHPAANTLPYVRISAFGIWLLVFLCCVSAKAQDTDVQPTLNFHRWGSVTVFNGLPSDSVRAIAQTQDGVMWFGTDNGVARFDGRRVQTFAFDDPESNRIVTLKTDAGGNLWAGTHNGAFVYSGRGFQPVAGTAGVAVACFSFGDRTLLGTDAGYVMSADTREDGTQFAERFSTETLTEAEGKPLIITAVIPDGDRLIVATAGKGLLALKDGRFLALPSGTAPSGVNAALRDRDGNIWFGRDARKGSSGIYTLHRGMRAESVASPTAVVLALESDDSGVWAGTARYGLFHFRDSRFENFTFGSTSGGLRSDTIFSVFADREGVVWIGTNRGVSRYDPEGIYQEPVSGAPNSNFVRTFFNMWADENYAGTNRGLFVKGDDRIWKEVPGPGKKVIYAIANLVGGPTIVGTPEGVFDLSGKKILDGDVRSFASFNLRTYAAVFGRGVVDISSRTPQTVFADETVTSVKSQGGEKFWIGTAGRGLFSFDGRSAKLEAGPETLKSGTIWNMFQAEDETLYIAGQHGVFTFRNGDVQKIIDAEDVRDVFCRNGEVWAATTTRGLIHARRDGRFGWILSSVGFEQGMPSEKAFLIRPDGDGLIVATNRGIVYYRPQKYAPKLTAIRVLGQRVHDLAELASTIDLEFPQNSLLVEVAGQSSRTFPEEFQYSFLLKDAKGEVVDSRLSGDPQYAPADLRPGEYAIEAVAFNRDLLASEPLVIRFSVAKAPFPWTATALGVLLAIALVGLVWAAFEHRRIRQRNRELKAARFDLANEAERERSRIARDLHDQTLADLRELMIKSDKGAPEPRVFRGEIEAVSTEIRRICEDLSPSVLENVGLIAALEFLLSSTIEDYRFSAEPGVEEQIVFPMNVQLQIYRIVQEVLNNIRKHSDARTVEIAVEAGDDALKLSVKDDGSFFEPNGNGAGRGIANIKARAGLIGGKIAWKRRRSGGNAFTLTVKAK